jgi:hypothetical protein
MNRYISRYSNDKAVSSAQYITELICEKKAKINREDLHYRFWLSKKWSVFFKNQIATANKLLLKYNSKAIIQALLDKRADKIFSLRAPHLLPIIQEKEKLLENSSDTFTKNIERKENIVFNKTKNKINKSIISKLEDIDNVN